MVTMFVFMIGFPIIVIYCAIKGICQGIQASNHTRQNPIDKYGDENYGTIDWLKDGKL